MTVQFMIGPSNVFTAKNSLPIHGHNQ